MSCSICFDDEQYVYCTKSRGTKARSWSCHSGLDLGLVSFGLGLVVLVLVLRIWSCSHHCFLIPHLQTPKDIATKRGEATSRTQLCHHADRLYRRQDICPWTKLTILNTLYKRVTGNKYTVNVNVVVEPK